MKAALSRLMHMNKSDYIIIDLIKDLTRKKKESYIIKNKPFKGLVFSEIVKAFKNDASREDKKAIKAEINKLIENGELKYIKAEPALFLVLPNDYSKIIDNM